MLCIRFEWLYRQVRFQRNLGTSVTWRICWCNRIASLVRVWRVCASSKKNQSYTSHHSLPAVPFAIPLCKIFTGPIPRHLALASKLQCVSLRENRLTGKPPFSPQIHGHTYVLRVYINSVGVIYLPGGEAFLQLMKRINNGCIVFLTDTAVRT